MQVPPTKGFDEWLWSLDQRALERLSLEGLQRRAAEASATFPQITATTLLYDAADPVSRVARTATGAEDWRATRWGGLIRAQMKDKPYVVVVWKAEQEGVMHFLASPPWTDSRWRRVEGSWINAAAPDVARVLLNNDEFHSLGDTLSEFGSVAVSRMAARVLADNSSYTRGWPGDEAGDHPDHRAALSEVQPGMAVQTLTLTVGSLVAIHLRRQAGATFYRGDFRFFVSVVLARLAAAAAERRAVLTGHQRKVSERISSAIVMTFDKTVVTGLRERLMESFAKTSGVRAAVLHGNPYLHLIVTDYMNGSNFDVVVTEQDRLRVLPGFKATPASLARITDVIGDALGMRALTAEAIPRHLSEAELFAE